MAEETNIVEIPDLDSYEDALETAALAKMEIRELFNPAKSRQKKLWKLIFEESDTSKFEFAKKLMYYQAGIPNPDSKAKMEGFRKQISAMVELMFGLGLGENLQKYFAEAGVKIEPINNKYENHKNLNNSDKITKLWDIEFFGEELPYSGVETLKMLMDHAKNTEDDIVKINKYVEAVSEEACFRFNQAPAGFKKALDFTVKEKLGKDIQTDLQKIEDTRNAIDEALKPFTHEPDVEEED